MIDDRWADYARLQTMLKRTTDANRSAGIDEAMSDLLEKIAAGEAIDEQKVNHLVINRVSKQRRRHAIAYRHREYIAGAHAAASSVESRLTIKKCADLCGPEDFRLIVCRALGYTYREIAAVTDRNENSLKTRVHRARSVIRYLAA